MLPVAAQVEEAKDLPSLYVHIPFCLRKCPYCGFASEAKRPGRVGLFLEASAREARLARGDLAGPLQTVYIGGGTPSVLDLEEMRRLFELLENNFDLSAVSECTVEANPGAAGPDWLRTVRELGANRLSLGVQSFRDEHLRTLGRIHTSGQGLESFEQAREAGFENVSMDLIFAVPGQTTADVLGDIEMAASLRPEHVSVYSLTYEPGTPFAERRDSGEIIPVEEEIEREMYLAAIDGLERAGYRHYEISNFALPRHECRHNLVYWKGGEYLGLGPSGASFIRGERRANARGLEEYAALLSKGKSAAVERERLTPEKAAREALMLLLRTREGAEAGAFKKRTGFDLAELIGEAGEKLIGLGMLEWGGGNLRLTRNALPVADAVMAEMI